MGTINRTNGNLDPKFERLFAAHDDAAPRTWTGEVTVTIVNGKAITLSARRESDYPPRS